MDKTRYSQYSDTKLATLLSQSDEKAFEVLYQRYWEKLLAIAGRRLQDQQEAEEVLQDIFLNLWRRRTRLTLRTGFDQYFAVALKFEIINRLAKISREGKRNEQYLHHLSPLSNTQQEKFDLDFLKKSLEDTISALPGKCQLVFRMSREQELSNREIAGELGISEKAVEKHKTNALRILRERFGNRLQIILAFF